MFVISFCFYCGGAEIKDTDTDINTVNCCVFYLERGIFTIASSENK